MFIKQLIHDLNFNKYVYFTMAALMLAFGALVYFTYTPPEPCSAYIPWWFFVLLFGLPAIGITCIIKIGQCFNKIFCKHTWHIMIPPNITIAKILISKITTAMIWFIFITCALLIMNFTIHSFNWDISILPHIWLYIFDFLHINAWAMNSLPYILLYIYGFLHVNALAFFFINLLFLCITIPHSLSPYGKLQMRLIFPILGVIGWVWLYFRIESNFFITTVFGIATALATYYLLRKCTVYVNPI